nr:Gag-Pol polyprotein [Tanacetum cinerariifolium]
MAKSDPPEEVIYRAIHLLELGFGKYHVVRNNCEDFALYCNTGLMIRGKPTGSSGQVNAVRNLPWKTIFDTAGVATIVSSLGVVPGGVAAVVKYSRNRYETDIGVRDDVEKVNVEEAVVFLRCHFSQQVVSERMNRTLLERARAMLATTSLGKSFWAEAVNTACYVINRSPSTAIELKTPMEMWTGKPVKYSDLHIIGSSVYAMYNSQETTKLDSKSRKCFFLGYADGVKGYRLWDPTAQKVVISRDVVFMEDKIQKNEESDSTTRESTSIQIEKEFQSNDSSEAVPQHEDGEPSTLQEALNNPDASFWKEAMQEEIEALHKNQTLELVPLLGGRKPIGNKWVYKIKRNGDDQVERYRARLVVKGYAQREGIDFNEIFSPVVRMITIRVVLAMCATRHGIGSRDLILSSRAWNITDYMQTLVHISRASPNKYRINKLKAQLAREFEIKDLRPANKILGMQIHRDRVSRNIWLSQKSYVKKILQRFNMQDLKRDDGDVSSTVCISNGKFNVRDDLYKTRHCTCNGSSESDSDLFVTGYVDSDYACDLDGSKSTTGYVFTLSGGTVSWVSKLQSVVAMLTTEAEYVAAAQASKEAVWLKMLLEELGYKQEKITPFCDNQSTLYLARNPTFYSKIKHIRVQYHFVSKKVEE